MIVGIDEVGRGAWAGPLVVGAVLLGGANITGLTDSKKLSRAQREALDVEIRKSALGIGLGWVSARQVDQIGLSSALKLASRRALMHIRQDYKEIIIDGTIRLIEDPRVTLMKKADLLIPSVSAASIVAKVARDNYMRYVDTIFPGYKFRSHVGYGTVAHRNAIKELGVTPLHRLSYTPLHDQKVSKRQTKLHELSLTTKQIGDAAEERVAFFLKAQGHEVLERNWRTKFCEIDIISRKGGTIYFTEVKYRKTPTHGSGLAAITAKKQRQMLFAAELFAADRFKNHDLLLAAAAVSGTPPQVEHFLEIT